MVTQTRPERTPAQQLEADHLRESMLEAASADLKELADLLADTPDEAILGQTEFLVRDIVHRVGAKFVETALRERKKGGTTVRA